MSTPTSFCLVLNTTEASLPRRSAGPSSEERQTCLPSLWGPTAGVQLARQGAGGAPYHPPLWPRPSSLLQRVRHAAVFLPFPPLPWLLSLPHPPACGAHSLPCAFGHHGSRRPAHCPPWAARHGPAYPRSHQRPGGTAGQLAISAARAWDGGETGGAAAGLLWGPRRARARDGSVEAGSAGLSAEPLSAPSERANKKPRIAGW